MEKKFELTENFIVNTFGVKLFQIRCTKSFHNVKEGDLGGYVEKEENLSQEDDAWVYDNAWIEGSARIGGNACIGGDAWIRGNARIGGNAWIGGNACIGGNAWIEGSAWINDDDSHCGFDCFGSVNRHTHAYRTKENNIEIRCGCFRGSIEDFEKRVEETHKGTIYDEQYKAIIKVIKIKFGIEL